mmetsp:Transcript_10012/g.22420  ORF Transcript_10012/g.22420 Transcript_10012/m.22420 type:complete len:128 (-) Transcript_10012:898-1281(-)
MENSSESTTSDILMIQSSILATNNPSSLPYALQMQKMSWRPPKSFALTLSIPKKKRAQASADETEMNGNQRTAVSLNDDDLPLLSRERPVDLSLITVAIYHERCYYDSLSASKQKLVISKWRVQIVE